MKKLFMFIMLLSFPFVTVNAKQLHHGNEIKPKEDINRSAFFFGSTVKNESNVDGISFIAGDTIDDQGISKYTFMAGRELTVESNIENDLFIAGENVLLRKSTIVGRDVYAAANSLKIAGEITGNVNAYGRMIVIDDATIKGNIYLKATNITIGEDTVIEGKLSYNDDAVIVFEEDVKDNIANINVYENKLNFNERATYLVQNGLRALFGMLFISLIIIILRPNTYENINKNTKKYSVIKNITKGFLLLLFVPLISLFLVMSWFGVSLGIILLILYGLGIYFTNFIVGVILGKHLFTKVFKQKENVWLSTMTGITVVYILKYMPYVGGLISFFIILYGLGFLYELIKPKQIIKK